MLNDDEGAREYVERATTFALGGVTEAFTRHGGRFVSSEGWQDERGYWLRVRGTLDDRPDVEVRYDGILLMASGADKAAETEGLVYGSGFEERLHLHTRGAQPVDGVITL